jgi:hypothetical protein
MVDDACAPPRLDVALAHDDVVVVPGIRDHGPPTAKAASAQLDQTSKRRRMPTRPVIIRIAPIASTLRPPASPWTP